MPGEVGKRAMLVGLRAAPRCGFSAAIGGSVSTGRGESPEALSPGGEPRATGGVGGSLLFFEGYIKMRLGMMIVSNISSTFINKTIMHGSYKDIYKTINSF